MDGGNTVLGLGLERSTHHPLFTFSVSASCVYRCDQPAFCSVSTPHLSGIKDSIPPEP